MPKIYGRTLMVKCGLTLSWVFYRTFWYFAKFSFHHKSKEAWLLIINMVYTSCLTSCQTPPDFYHDWSYKALHPTWELPRKCTQKLQKLIIFEMERSTIKFIVIIFRGVFRSRSNIYDKAFSKVLTIFEKKLHGRCSNGF